MTRLLYFLSNTDEALIARCPDSAKRAQMAKGAYILFTALLTVLFLSYGVFVSSKSFLLATTGLACGVLNLFVLRALFSARSKTAALSGLLLAIFTGLVLSVPLELRLFQGSIDKEILKRPFAERDARISELRAEVVDLRQELTRREKEFLDEALGVPGPGMTGVQGIGPAFKARKEIYEGFRAQSTQRITELSEEIREIELEKASLRADPPGDLLSRYEALSNIHSASPDAWRMSWGLRLLLIMLEATPFLLRLLEGRNPYTELVESRYAREERDEQGSAPDVNVRVPLPGFARGFAGAVDVSGALAPTAEGLRGGAESAVEADVAALAHDWETVGDDLRRVLNKYGAESSRRVA